MEQGCRLCTDTRRCTSIALDAATHAALTHHKPSAQCREDKADAEPAVRALDCVVGRAIGTTIMKVDGCQAAEHTRDGDAVGLTRTLLAHARA